MLALVPKTAIILAGGKSSRMGQDKGLMKINGKPMIQHVIDTVTPFVDTIRISTSNVAYEQFNAPCFSDIFPDLGPLGGIYTGLHYTNTSTNIVLSCDTPLISKELIQELINTHNSSYNITTISYKEQLMPTIGMYEQQCNDTFKKRLENGQLKLVDAVKAESYQILTIESPMEKQLMNINTKEEYQKLQ